MAPLIKGFFCYYLIIDVLFNGPGFPRIRRLLGVPGNGPGFAELGQARNATLVTENLYAAAGDAPFCGGFGD